MPLTRHPLLSALLVVCCLVAGALLVQTIARIGIAYGDGPPVAVALDAGHPAVDAGPEPVDTAKLPDPLTAPEDSLGVVNEARKTGSLWLAAILALIMAGKAYVRRMMPDPSKPIDPLSWRAKSVVLVSSAIVVLAALADKLLGAGAWTAVAIAAFGLLLAGVDAFNPPKGTAGKAASGAGA